RARWRPAHGGLAAGSRRLHARRPAQRASPKVNAPLHRGEAAAYLPIRSVSSMSRARIPAALLPLLALFALPAGCGGVPGPAPSTGTPSASTPTTGTASTGRTAVTESPSPTAVAPQSPAPVESNPPGDIPDTVAYVPYRNALGR